MTTTNGRIGRALLVLSVSLWTTVIAASAAWAVPTGSGTGGGEISGAAQSSSSGMGAEIGLMVLGGVIALAVMAAVRYATTFQRRKAAHA